MRHILSCSGGEDSAALTIYVRDRVAGKACVFSNSSKALRETHDYLESFEDHPGTYVRQLNAIFGFDRWCNTYGGMIPQYNR